MAHTSNESVKNIFTEMASLAARLCSEMPWAIVIGILSWVIPPLGALVATLLIIYVYQHRGRVSEMPITVDINLKGPLESRFLMFLGLFFIAIGVVALARQVIPEIPSWQIFFILLGVLLIWIGISRRS
jgi:hypothetical protein